MFRRAAGKMQIIDVCLIAAGVEDLVGSGISA
jgi:hypothetical protein